MAHHTQGTKSKQAEQGAHLDAAEKVDLTPAKLAKIMQKIDFCMMTTVADDGALHSRPMSNNRNVEWDGDTWFFADADSSQAREVQRNPNVNLGYADPDDIVFISVTGRGEIVNDTALKKEYWFKDLERWFPNGPEDLNVALIKVSGRNVYYWSKQGDGALEL